MDTKKCGSFIAAQRKERSLTQAQLACAIGVTDKAVSRWETGKGFPDVDSLVKLSQYFDITVNELLLGELGPQEAEDKALLQMCDLREGENKVYKRVLVTLVGITVLIALLFAVAAGFVYDRLNRTEVYSPQALIRDLLAAEAVEVCVDNICVADDIDFLFVSKLHMSEWVLTSSAEEEKSSPVAVITTEGDDRIQVYLYEHYAVATLKDYAAKRFKGVYAYPQNTTLSKELLM